MRSAGRAGAAGALVGAGPRVLWRALRSAARAPVVLLLQETAGRGRLHVGGFQEQQSIACICVTLPGEAEGQL